MSIINDIIDGNNASTNTWIKKQDEQRQWCYTNMDYMALQIARNGELFKILSFNLADVKMNNTIDSSYNIFKNQCICYMLCKKYDIKTPDYDFSKIPTEISSLKSGKDIRNTVNELRMCFKEIHEIYIEERNDMTVNKKTRNKEQER